jgi:hypothetical protein
LTNQTDFLWVILLIISIMSLCGSVPAQSDYDIANRIDLIPAPRDITVSDVRIDLSGWRIILAEDSSLCRLGAEEINQRLIALGAKNLPIILTPDASYPCIIVGSCRSPLCRLFTESLDVELTPENPGEQGYVIACGDVRGVPAILAGGSDEQGALYACITLCRLIQKLHGNACLTSAQVRDWPDFKIRCNSILNLRLIQSCRNTETMTRIADDLKKQIDFCLHHKINYVHANAYWSRPVTDNRARAVRRHMVDVCRYAQSRGIRTRVIGNTEIGSYLTPAQREDAVIRSPGTSFMWSALDEHRNHAMHLAEYLRDAKIGVFALHPVDSGGYLDPETWSRRSQACRAMYGDNRSLASLEQFQLYYNIIREQCPDLEFEAVSYPYHYQFAMPEFPEQAQAMGADMPSMGWVRGVEDGQTAMQVQRELCDYHRNLSEGLPQEVSITFREAGRDIFLACGDLYQGHPVTIWIYPDRNKGWRGTFCPQVRMAKTFWRPSVRDHYFVASSWARGNDARVQQLAQQEYLWHVDRPDASEDFTPASRWYETEGRNVTDYQRDHLIPRICRELYGPAAPVFQKLVVANVSLNYILEPETVASERGENFANDMSYMAEQADVMSELYEDFSQILDATHNDESYPPEALAWALYWRKFSGIAAIKASLHLEFASCRTLLAEGKAAQALAEIEALHERLPMYQTRCDEIHSETDHDPLHTLESSYSGSVDNRLHVFRPSDMSVILDAFEDRVLAAAALGTIPPHVQTQLENRKIEVCLFNPSNEVIADANRGEGGWLNSQTVDFFTVGKNRLAQFETIGWILWDEYALYFYFEAYDPQNLEYKPVVSSDARNGDVFKDDCFEIFLKTSAVGNEYFHFAVSSAGVKYGPIKRGPDQTDSAWNATDSAVRDSEWTAIAARGKDRWIAEVYIPFSTLGVQPEAGDAWSINLSRHRAARGKDSIEEYSNIIGYEQFSTPIHHSEVVRDIDSHIGINNHRPDLFLPLLFTDELRIYSPREVGVFLESVDRYDQTTTHGYSTFLSFNPVIESDRSLVNQIIMFEVFDSQGNKILEEMIDDVRIPGRWSPSNNIVLDLGRAFPDNLTISITCGGRERPMHAASFIIDANGQVVED